MKHRSFFRIALFSILMLVLMSASIGEAQAHPKEKDLFLRLKLQGLQDLGTGWVYEGWLIVAGEPVSSGRFTVDANGRPSMKRFPVDVDPRDVQAFVLTIEPDPDPDPGPSAAHLLAGDFTKRKASLSVAHPAAFGNNFSSASGDFILAVPSDPNTPYTNGIWWLDPAGGPGPSLVLPSLPDGWTYEGWVVGPNGPISTGTFLSPSGADSDAGGPYAGPNPTPPFPGQDFVNPPMSLIGQTAVITIEPVPDNSPAPFFLKPLVDNVIEDTGAAGILQSMTNNASAFPTGRAKLTFGEDDD
jgi:hypothetical protein